mmetsp:Transcript_146654/g.273092  ORF Transcript_146654/g.273092 Transcript_146654/m.273092 type:complete len:179 (+) Transcript_146654:39-575(+)
MVVPIMPSMRMQHKVSHTALPRHGVCAALRQVAACVHVQKERVVAPPAAVPIAAAPLAVAAALAARRGGAEPKDAEQTAAAPKAAVHTVAAPMALVVMGVPQVAAALGAALVVVVPKVTALMVAGPLAAQAVAAVQAAVAQTQSRTAQVCLPHFQGISLMSNVTSCHPLVVEPLMAAM